MKVLAIVASGRREGNVSRLCDSILKGAVDANHEVNKINILDYHIAPCKGCYACTTTHRCAIRDDFDELYQLEKEADYLVYGFPIYDHSLPGILKTFMERHAHAVFPYYDDCQKQGFWEKTRSAMAYLKGFKANRPFINKKVVTVIACTNPLRNGRDIQNARFLLKNYYEEIGLTAQSTIICTDTLFRFKEGRIDKAMGKAYEAGRKIR